MSLTLVVLAAGMGSRYGGLKQVDPVGPHGEILLEYSVFDALRAGFDRVVAVIRPDLQADFEQHIAARLRQRVPVEFAFQRLEDLPAGFSLPEGRTKPWGTGQAVLCCESVVGNSSFLAINADDFYGPASYRLVADQLRAGQDEHCMAAFGLRNTLSEHGSVSRGLCEVGSDGWLSTVTELTDIVPRDDGAVANDGLSLTGEEPVSMNFWGLRPTIFGELKSQFETFLAGNPGPKSELYLPGVLDGMIRGGRGRVRVLHSPETWFGVTYPQDKPRVTEQIAARVAEGQYPERLWT